MKQFIYLFVFTLLFTINGSSQYIFSDNNHPDKVSLFSVASISEATVKELSIQSILNDTNSLKFAPVKNEYQNIGFTNDHYWAKLSLSNQSKETLLYYLETARPVTDHADLYIVDPDGKISEQHSGDNIPFHQRSFDNRKTIFKLLLSPKKSYKLYLHLKSDGEVISLPLFLHSSDDMIHITYLEQLVFGFFYGILLLAAIIYLFFYFGMRDKSFLYYSLYVVFVGLMQFSLDGYFFEYITPRGGWFYLHSVLIFATIGAFFLGKYTENFLNIPIYIKKLSVVFRTVYLLIGLLLILLFFIPPYYLLAYPLANLFGLLVLGLIIYSIFYLNYKKLPVDHFFTTGILFLVAGFVIFILNNFNIIPTTFLSQNSSKFGTGMEVIFISLSMANRIGKLRKERENLIVDLTASNQDLKQFTYITSHDLRAPISNLMGLVRLFESSSEPGTRNSMVITKISESANRLNDTVSDLINILLIKNNTEISQSILKFSEVLNVTKAAIENIIEESGAVINVNFSNSEVVYFSKNYLESIFLNLLTNSIRYRSENRSLIIDIRTKIKDHAVQLIFSDNGSGINLERHRGKIFGMHQRFHSNKESKGVGLYIIKSQIISLGGTIDIESEENVGTTFIITFKKNGE